MADKLIELCRKGENGEAVTTLFTDDVKSIKANDLMGLREVQRIEAIEGKSIAFQQRVATIYGSNISEPVVAGNSFAIGLTTDVTFKGEKKNNDRGDLYTR